MVKVIMGGKGTGKTKALIASINESMKNETGSMVCIEKGDNLRYDINYRVRLVNIEDYCVEDMRFLQGFISGLHAGNFDISHVFIDSLHKILGQDREKILEFCRWCEAFAGKNDMRFTFTVTDDPETVSDEMKKYL